MQIIESYARATFIVRDYREIYTLYSRARSLNKTGQCLVQSSVAIQKLRLSLIRGKIFLRSARGVNAEFLRKKFYCIVCAPRRRFLAINYLNTTNDVPENLREDQ